MFDTATYWVLVVMSRKYTLEWRLCVERFIQVIEVHSHRKLFKCVIQNVLYFRRGTSTMRDAFNQSFRSLLVAIVTNVRIIWLPCLETDVDIKWTFPQEKPVFEGLRTTKVLTSLPFSAGWSTHLLFDYGKVWAVSVHCCLVVTCWERADL